MIVYTEGREVTPTDCQDVLIDMARDLRGLFILTNDAATSDNGEMAPVYMLVSELAYRMAETLDAVVIAMKHDENGGGAC